MLGWCVYILRCQDGTLYTGCSSALSRRLVAHAKGSAKYTRSRLPVSLLYAESVRDHSEALRREAAIKKLGGKRGKLYVELRTRFQEQGDQEALEAARALIEEAQNLSMGDRERLFGYVEGGGKMILSEPRALLTEASRMPGLDGQKMSKSYGNAILMRDDPAEVTKKIRTMQTDPARVRRSDKGNPEPKYREPVCEVMVPALACHGGLLFVAY